MFNSSKNLFEVTEEFIQNYNETEDIEEREKLNGAAYKMLERIKVYMINKINMYFLTVSFYFYIIRYNGFIYNAHWPLLNTRLGYLLFSEKSWTKGWRKGFPCRFTIGMD